MSKVCDGVFWGVFCTNTLLDQHTIVLTSPDNNISITLCSNDYALFDSLFTNLKWLLD